MRSVRAGVALAVLLGWVAGSFVGAGTGLSAAKAGLPAIVIGQAHGGFTPEPTGRHTITILAIGSDARPGQNPLTSRADSIHVIFLHPRKRQAVVVGIPRDSWVSIPGLGTSKINAALASGGPSRMVETIERNFGARIDYWAIASFWGLPQMVNEIGGLRVHIPFRMHDRNAKTDLHPGVRRLRGWQVLAFARDRHSLRSGDFGRQENGGRVLLAALTQFRQEYRKDPARLLTWIAAGARHVDMDLSIKELIDLAFTATSIRPGRVQNVVLPGGTGTVGGRSIVQLSMGTARAIFADAKADGTLRRGNIPRSPTGVR